MSSKKPNASQDLYHGTSMRALLSILVMGYIELPATESVHISLTDKLETATHWAMMSGNGGGTELFGIEDDILTELECGTGGAGVVIRVRRASLEVEECHLFENDPSDGETLHAAEIACDKQIQARLFDAIIGDRDAFLKLGRRILSMMPDRDERNLAQARFENFAETLKWEEPVTHSVRRRPANAMG